MAVGPDRGGACAGIPFACAGGVHIICLGDTSWEGVPDPAHELARRFARRGHRVLYLNPSGAAASRPDAALLEAEPGLHVVTLPGMPPSGDVSARDARRLRRALSRTVGRLGLRGAVALSFRPGREWMVDSGWASGLLSCRSDEWDDYRDRVNDDHAWERALDALILRLQEAQDRAADARPGRRSPAAGPPHQHLQRRRATLSWKAQVAFACTVAAGRIYYLARLCWRTLTSPDSRGIRRILIARPRCHLGDLIVLFPMLSALRRRFPNARIVLAAQPEMPAARLLERTGYVDALRTFDHLEPLSPSTAERPTAARLAGALELYAEGYDLVISGATYFLQREPFFAGAPYRIGFDEGHPLQALNSLVVPFDSSRHEADNNLELARLLGADLPSGERMPRLPPDEHRAELFAQLREALQLPLDAPVLTVHPGSKMPTRRWPPDRFAQLVSALLEERPTLRVVFSGVSGEVPLVNEILGLIRPSLRARAVSAAGLTDLFGLRSLLEHSVALVCNDTGSMHLARALGTPLVALMGPENHLRWGPYPQGSAPAVVLRHEVPCAPCRREHCEQLYCLRSLEVGEALGAVRALLDGTPEGTAVKVHLQRHSWRDLAADGFELPLVTVVVFPAAGEQSAHADLPGSTSEAEVLAALQQQDYPNWEVCLARGGDPLIGLQQVLSRTAGELVVPLRDRPRWAPTRLSYDVAALLRDPLLPVAGAGPSPYIPPRMTDLAGFYDLTVRREALLERLAPEPPADYVASWSDRLTAPDLPRGSLQGRQCATVDAK